MRTRLLVAAFACVLVIGCAALQKSQSYFWVEAFQNGKQIGIWRTAPGSGVVEDFGSYKFTADDGSQVVLTGGNLVVVVNEVKPGEAGEEPEQTKGAPAAAPESKKE